MWGFGILVLVLLAIFGGLYKSQTNMENKIIGALNSHTEANTKEQKEINKQIGDIQTDLTVMQTNFENFTKTGKWSRRPDHAEEKKGQQ